MRSKAVAGQDVGTETACAMAMTIAVWIFLFRMADKSKAEEQGSMRVPARASPTSRNTRCKQTNKK
jgi:hypothetical protein